MLRANASVGVCDAAPDASDCEHGRAGTFPGSPDHTGCIEQCRRCARCRFVSIAAGPRGHSECRWFSQCTVPLQVEHGGGGFLTVEVPKA